ncbi:hypothetical protein SOVF_032530 [Spinacia oleracea]|nr:hypothetical protein SOVF_032530 [Spinacia oleracea]
MSNQVEEAVPDVPEAVSAASRKLKKAKRKMKDRSEVWEHFLKTDTPDGMKATCKYCKMEYKCDPKKNGTSCLWTHINKCRKYPYNTPKDSKQTLLSFHGNVKAGETSSLTYHKFDAASLRKALAYMIVVEELPFKFVEGIVDNASSNDTAIGYMRRKINGWKSGVLKGRFLHMRCVAHIVNLVVSDGMETVNESITRVRHAVRFIKQSPSRLLRFKKCVSDEKIVSKKLLCLDVPTRWNSTYLMLSAAISLESAFDRYAEEDPHYTVDLCEREGKCIPESEDWNSVKKFSEFLQTFYDLTNRVSGSLYVTSNLFFHELVNVAVLLKELKSSDDPDMCLMACKMKEKYEKYRGDPEKMNLMIFVAVVLDPRYKFDYVEWMLTEIYDVTTASILARNVKDILSDLFEEYRILPPTDVREEVSSTKDDIQSTTSHKKVEVLKSLVCNQNWLRAGPFQGVEECLEEVELLEEDLNKMSINDAVNHETIEIDE